MAYETFIPRVWNKELNHDLFPKLVLAQHTNRKYEGDVKNQGDSVRIMNVGKPTIYSLNKATQQETLAANINAAETIDNSSITMLIDQIKYFNYRVDDIDKAQTVGNLMGEYRKETTESLAEEVDKYIGQTIFPEAPVYTNDYSNATYDYIKVTAGDSEAAQADAAQNALELMDDVLEKAHENNIPDSTKLYVNCSPKFWKYLKRSFVNISTDNVKELNGRQYLRYNNMDIEWSNNVKKVAAVDNENAAYEYVTVRTERAVAYVHPFTHSEPYRLEKGFSDAIKGFILFDAKIVRPKEIFNVKVTY